jgi:hypothetical protein
LEAEKVFDPLSSLHKNDFYCDADFLIENDLIDSDISSFSDYNKDEESRKILLGLLPKISADEEPERDYLSADASLEEYCSELTKDPTKAREYVKSALSEEDG